MGFVLVTGSAGLVGAEVVKFFSEKGLAVVGVDNDSRRSFFGDEASTSPNRRKLEETFPLYIHHDIDIRDKTALEEVFHEYGSEIRLIVHTAAQPSHDWAAGNPSVDFSINALGTLNLLECTRAACPKSVFIFTSTNKVYGDNPNRLPFVERETRWELDPRHRYAAHGIDEHLSVDQTLHSLFGVSKLAADSLVQEYGRYFGMKTVCFRCGCLTGPGHAGVMLHGFLSYLVKCAVGGIPYTIFGYQGKQVRDNLHALDLANMFWHYYQDPRPGEVYNVGGGRHSNCSILEAIQLCEKVTRRKMDVRYVDSPRLGDHRWYISDIRKFQSHFPGWTIRYDFRTIIEEIANAARARTSNPAMQGPHGDLLRTHLTPKRN